MSGLKHVVVLAVGLAVALAGMAMAGQQRPYRLSDQQLKDLVSRIGTHRDAFHGSLARALDRTPITGSPSRDQIDRSMKDFEQATNLLRDRVNDRRSETADAEGVLRRASSVDSLVRGRQLDARAQSDWQALRQDMNDLARAYGIAWNWSAVSQNPSYRVNDKQVKQLLKQIGQKAERFDKSLDRAFDRSPAADRQGKNEIRQSVKDFRQTTDRLGERVNGRESNTVDVEEVLRRGVSIDAFMRRYQLSAQAEQNWLSLRGDLDGLARAYNVAWNWANPRYTPAEPGTGLYQLLTGTYQLENTQGDDARRAAELASRAAPSDQRERTYQSLLTRLEAPERIAIERNGNSVTMASTRGQRVTFEADGRDHLERWPADQTMSTRATLEGERLMVVTTDNRRSDFTLIFDPIGSGRGLQITRTIDDVGLRQPVTVRHSYRRLSDAAQWNLDSSDWQGPYAGSQAGVFVVPDGTRLVAWLDNPLSTRNAREGDQYSMTTRSPSQYEGAVIQGFVSSVNESGRLTGRAGMTLNLRSIRLRNGASYQFDGIIEDVRTPGGATVRMDREGALAGGGNGAAIGAMTGAGGGAGTVMVEGRDRLDLERGTELTITSGNPRNQRAIAGVQR